MQHPVSVLDRLHHKLDGRSTVAHPVLAVANRADQRAALGILVRVAAMDADAKKVWHIQYLRQQLLESVGHGNAEPVLAGRYRCLARNLDLSHYVLKGIAQKLADAIGLRIHDAGRAELCGWFADDD